MLTESGFETQKVFIDRTMELAKLHTALKVASSGKGRIILVEGEAGIGKTALIERFLSDKHDVKINRSEGKYGESEPYAPIKEVMGTKEMGEELAREIPLLGLMPLPSSRKKEPENLSDKRDKMFDAFVSFIKRSTKKTTTIYILDNAHWVDEASAKLILRALPKLESSKILFIMMYRPEDVPKSGAVEDLISQLKVLEASSTIKLQRFGYEDVVEMIKAILKRDDLPKSFVNTVYKETEGNPMFVQELLLSLVHEGVIDPTSYSKIETGKIRVPPTIKEVLLRKIAKLNPDAKSVLSYAAIIGVRFDFGTLQSLTGIDEERLLDAVDKLLETGIIEEDTTTDEEVYSFSYIQLKEIVEASLSKSRRRVIHKKIGEHMEKTGYDAYSVTEHFLKGGVYDKAYKYAIKAAEKSIESLGFESAVHYYNIALEALEKMSGEKNEEELVDILVKLGNLYKILGEWDEAIKIYSRTLELAEKIGKDDVLADVNLSMGAIEKSRGEWDDANVYFEAANKVAKRMRDYHRMGDAERFLGYVHWRRGEYADAVSHYTTAIKYAKETNDSGMAGKIFVEMGNVYSDMGNIEKAIEYYQKSIPRLKKIREYQEIARVLNNLGDSHLQLGNWDKAVEYFGRSEEAAAKIGDINLIGWALFNGAEAYARKGDVKKAKKYCDESYGLMGEMDDKVAIGSIHRVYGIIYAADKKWDDAVKHLQLSVKIFKDLDIPHLLAQSLFELGSVYAKKGETKHANRNYEEALKMFKKINSKFNIEKVSKALEELKT